MAHDGTPHCIFKISELARLIASQLVSIDRGGVVSLACACRYLEEPVLSALWETQSTLSTLLKVLPEETRESRYPQGICVVRVVGDPSPEAWNRVQRYASWMCELWLDRGGTVTEDTFYKLRLSSPTGGWFPALQCLCWHITESNLPHADLFFSPHLKKISINMPWSPIHPELPRDVLAAVASTITALPTSALQSLSVYMDGRASVDLKDSLSSVVLRCGPSLTKFISQIPLSDAAVNYLIQLPHLHTWHTEDSPPSYPISFPLVFPPLTEFALRGGVVHDWFSLFEHVEDSVPTMRGATPLSRVRGSLRRLEIDDGFSDLVIDNSLTSPIRMFRNLARLYIAVKCPVEDGEGQCSFRLTNDDVTKLAVALPQLESLLLGAPCPEDTCATTAACLLPISVHCVKLEDLEIHFNTANIVNDFKNISKDPRLQELHSLPRCTLSRLFVGEIPLTLDGPGFETVVDGMIDIFPSLERCLALGLDWDEISERMAKHREV